MADTEIPTIVAIPTIGKSPYLNQLARRLHIDAGFDQLYILDNTEDGDVLHDYEHKLNLSGIAYHNMRPSGGWSLHKMWNWVWQNTVNQYGTANVCLLNDDIEIPRYFTQRLGMALRSSDDVWCVYPNYHLDLKYDGYHATYEDTSVDPSGLHTVHAEKLTQTHGTYKDGGMWGCAFMLRAELLQNPVPPIDTQFQIWCGDDDLVTQIELHGGKVCRVNDIALKHHASTSVNTRPELQKIGWEDLERFKAKYGRK